MTYLKTREGNETVKINETYIHSKYSPVKEARRFLENNLEKSCKTLITLGFGLGYIFPILENEYPETKVINIPISSELGVKSLLLNPSNRIQFSEGSIEQFIKSNISESSIKGLQLIYWTPVSTIYQDEFKKISDLISKRVRLINGNLMTTARFGKIWLKNSISNYINTDNYIDRVDIGKPIVITASGLTLSKGLKELKKVRERVTIISLSSSNMALNYYDIIPDFTISTDPGYYSKLHLNRVDTPLIMPLSNSKTFKDSVLLLNQGNFFENDIINLSQIPNITVGENGTVAGSALDLALKLTNHNIYLLGQDLEFSDIVGHVKPYAFDNLLKKSSTRISPYYNTLFRRWINSGVTFKTYRDWFSQRSKESGERVFRVTDKSTVIKNLKDITLNDFVKKILNTKNTKTSFSFSKIDNRELRQKKALDLIRRWIEYVHGKKNQGKKLLNLISASKSSDANNKALYNEAEKETINFLERLLVLYGRELL